MRFLTHRISFAISMVSNVVLLASVIVIYILTRPKVQDEYIPVDKSNVSVNFNSSGMCISCDSLGASVHAEETLYDSITTTECGRKVCCVKDQDHMRIVIQKLLNGEDVNRINSENNDTQVSRKYLEWWRTRGNAAHLILGKIPKQNGRLQWQSTDEIGLTFTKGLHIKDSTTIQIEEDGTYFVYTTVAYNLTGQDNVRPFYHQLLKNHPRLPVRGNQTIVMSKYGGKETTKTVESSFLSAVVKLLSKEEIWVKFSSNSYIDDRKDKSYFGIFRLW